MSSSQSLLASSTAGIKDGTTITSSGSVSTLQYAGTPAAAYSIGLKNRSVLRLEGLTTSTTSA